MNNKRIAIWSLALTAIGVVVAVIQLNKPSEPSPQQNISVSDAPPDCSSVGAQGSNVTINCDRSVKMSNPEPKSFATFEGPVDSSNIKEFASFIETNERKVVKLSLHFNELEENEAVSWNVNNDISGMSRFVVIYLTNCANGTTGCADSGGIEYVFVPVKGGDEAYYTCVAGDFCVDGYYSIEPVQGMNQGIVSIGIVRIPNADARLVDPAAR